MALYLTTLRLYDYDALGMQSTRLLRYDSFVDTTRQGQKFRVAFQQTQTTVASFLPTKPLQMTNISDHGGLQRLQPAKTSRTIAHDDEQQYEAYRQSLLNSVDTPLDSSYYSAEDRQDEPLGECRDVPWKDDQFPTCNDVHTLLLERPSIPGFSLVENQNVTYLR